MSKKVIVAVLTIAILGSIIPLTVNAFDLDFIQKIKDIVNWIKTIKDYSEFAKGSTFVFGGHITHSEGGCMLFAKYCPLGWCWGVPSAIRIPLGGNTIEVGPPVSSPEGQMFTFPFISNSYLNHNEDKEGGWALGIGFNQFPIEEINDMLGNIPAIPVPYGTIDDWHIDCSDNNKNLILKIGTS